MNRPIPRAELERFTAGLAEKRRRIAKAEHTVRGYRDEDGVWRGGLLSFVRYFWHILEPGTPFTDGWVLEAICEHLEAVTFGEITNLLINVPPGCCKALDHDTPILTTWGWKRHGDLAVDDFVFGPNGKPVRVLACSEEMFKESYEVVFDDGTKIIAGEDHLWAVERDVPSVKPRYRRGRKPLIVKTTELRPSGHRKGKVDQRPDRIAVAAPISLPPKRLPIDPYVLGAWLGDGASNGGNLYTAEIDIEHFGPLGRIANVMEPGKGRTMRFYRIMIDGMHAWLKQLGLLKNKHIPVEYLESSIDQRWALLQGLMDTDGTCAENGACSFSNKNTRLIAEVHQLCCSLGLKATVRSHIAKIKGVSFGTHYQVCFTPPVGAIVFRLDRKQARVIGNLNGRSRNRFVMEVNPLGIRPMKCIQVEGSLYLVGKTFVTTHNSLLTSVFWPAWEWSAMEMAHIRYVTFSYSSSNTERDNQRFGDLITSAEFKAMYSAVQVRQNGVGMVSNYKHGWKLASSVTGSATGKRGNRAICFPADQLVQTECGLIPIGDIVESRLALRVPSVDVKTGAISLQPIIGWHKNPASEIVKITLSDGSAVRCTPNHRFWDGTKWVEASDLRPGTALPVIGLADTHGDVAPRATLPNGLDSHSLDAVAGGQNISSICDVYSDLPNLILSKDCPPAGFQKCSMSKRVVDILLSSSVFQVACGTIRRLSVFMSDFLSFWAWSQKGVGNQLMNHSHLGFPVFTQVEPQVTLPESSLHDFASVGHEVSPLLVARAVSVGGHSPSAVDYSGHASHSPQTADFISPLKADNSAPFLSVVSVSHYCHAEATYCLTVDTNHTFVVGSQQGLIASNCDDLNNVKESESKAVLEETNRWFRESLSSRLNNMETDAKIVIAQRVAEGDVSGEILSLGLPYCHLCIPMEFVWQADDDGNPYTTSIGWVDPRWKPDPEDCEGELAWPERFSEKAVDALKVELAEYATAAQLQQTPEPRGGGLIKREYWQPAEQYMAGSKYPPFSYIVASLDGAFDQNESNDPSALTVWGVFQNEHGYNRAMLIHAWAMRLEISGPIVEPYPGEHESLYRHRAMQTWGLVEWTADTCNRFKADVLLIENKASGKPAAQSLQNSHGKAGWAIILVEPKGDKYARGLAVQPAWSQGMIFKPDRPWADDVVDEMAIFPKGKHDDRYDSACQAVKHMRDLGLLRSDEHRRAEEMEAVRHKGVQKPKATRFGAAFGARR